MAKTYWEKLQDPRWQKRRTEIMTRANFACERCSDTTETLHVNHKIYRKGADPWEYEDKDLECLCKKCHKSYHDTKSELDELLALMDPADFLTVLGYCRAVVTGFESGASIQVIDGEHATGIGDRYGIGYRGVIELLKGNFLYIDDVSERLGI